MPNSLENLHRNLTADGYNLGSLDDFKAAMSDSTKASNLHRNLSADGYNLGSREDFFREIGLGGGSDTKPAVAMESQPTREEAAVVQQQTEPQAAGQAGGQARQEGGADAPVTVAGVPRVPDRVKVSLGDRARKFQESARQWLPEKKTLGQAGAGQQGGTPLTREDRARMMGDIAERQAQVRAYTDSFDSTMKNREAFRKQQPLGKGLAKIGPRYNKETGKIEEMYTTPSGETLTKRQAQWQEFQLNGAPDPVADEVVSRAIDRVQQELHEKANARLDEDATFVGSLMKAENPGISIERMSQRNEEAGPEALWEAINGERMMNDLLSDEEALVRGADAAGMSVNDYINRKLIPELGERLSSQYGKYLTDRYDVKDFGDYITRRMLGSASLTLFSMGTMTPMQRQMMAGALERSHEGSGVYSPGFIGRLAGEVAMFAPDAPLMAFTGGAGSVATKMAGVGLKRLGMASLGRIVSTGSPWLAANVGKGVKWGGLALRNSLHGVASMGTFMGTSSAIQDLSIGDGTWSSTGKAFLSGFGEGAKLGGAMGVIGTGTGALGSTVTATGYKGVAGRMGVGAAAFVAENQLFANMDRFNEGEYDWVESTADAFYMQMAGKLSSPHGVQGMIEGGKHILTGRPVTGLDWHSEGFRLTDGERQQIQKAFGGMDLGAIAENPDYLGKILGEKKNISWVARQKVAGAMGMMESSRPRTYDVIIRGKQILERGKGGELIEVHDFKDENEALQIRQQIEERKKNDDMFSYLGILDGKPDNTIPTQAEIDFAKQAVIEQSKKAGKALRAEDVEPGGKSYDLVEDYVFANRKRPSEILIEQFATENGMTTEQVKGVMEKKPIERTEAEVSLIEELSKRLHDAAFPEGEPHPVQSEVDGENLAGNGPVVKPDDAISLRQEVEEATNTLNAFLNEHERMKEEVQDLLRQDAPVSEIMRYVADNYSGTERDEALRVLSDYDNALSKQRGYLNKTNDNINGYVEDEADRNGFSGSVNGMEDADHIITVSDGDRHFTLVNAVVYTRMEADQQSGEQREVINSHVGVMIGRDEDGRLVTLENKPGWFIESRMPKKDYADRLREELGVENTSILEEAGVIGQDAAVVQQQTERNDNANGIGRSLTEDEADDLILATVDRAIPMPEEVEMTPENWATEFGNGILTTPLGEVKISDNQYNKMAEKGRSKEFGMIKPTLTDPDFIIEESSEAKDGNTSRPTSYLFVKAFIGKNGEKRYFFKSVTVDQDGMEVNVSNHFDRAKRLRESLKNGKLLYRFDGGAQTEQTPATVSVTTPQTNPGVGGKSEPTTETTDTNGNLDGLGSDTALPQSPDVSGSKNTKNTDTNQGIDVKVDKNGVKLYEEGTPIDVAIDDIQRDGYDINQFADLAISEAQEELSKMKEAKSRAELIKNDARRKELQNIIDYYTQLKERYAELNPPYVDPQPYIDRLNATTSKRKADEIVSEALRAGVKPEEIQPVHTQRVSDIMAKEEEDRRKAEEITDYDQALIEKHKGTSEGRAYLLDKKRVPSAEKRRKIAELVYGELFDGDFDAWRDEQELISLWLGRGRALDPDSFGQELGWDMGVGKDAAKVSTMFTARRENGGDGMLFNDFVHMVMEASGGRYDTEEIRNAVIAMFQGAQEKSDLTEYQLTSRVAEAEQTLKGQEETEQEAHVGETAGADAPGTVAGDGMLPFEPQTDWSKDPFAPRWTLSDKTAANGEQFYQGADGNIDLVDIPQEVFDTIGYTKAPLRLTESMVSHILDHHGRELGSKTVDDVIGFVVDVMTNFDHVRLGDNGSLVFSIENGRDRTGRRAITILLNSDLGEFYGIKTSGYEVMRKLSKRPLLWERGVKESSTTDAASATVTSLDDQQSGGQSGNASDQSGLSSEGKDTKNPDTNQEKGEKKEEINTSDPLEAIEQAAESVRERDTQKTVNSSDNSINKHKGENNEAKNVVSLQQESPSEGERQPKLAGDATEEQGDPAEQDVRAALEKERDELTRRRNQLLSEGLRLGIFDKEKIIAETREVTERLNEVLKKLGETPIDEYLHPRNDKEREIIAGVEKKLAEDIKTSEEEVRKAKSALEKAKANESDRATDMFSDDKAFEKPGQLFSFDEMGGTDRTQEGVNRRTEEERKRLEEAQKKLDRLKSDAEYRSRIRGALDNERRQTSFEADADASATVSDPMVAIDKAAQEFKAEQDEQLGITHDETQEQINDKEHDGALNDTPLTTEEIQGAELSNVEKTLAEAYLSGNHGILQTAAYLKAIDNVRNRRQDRKADSTDAERGAQLDRGENQPERGSGRTGGSDLGLAETESQRDDERSVGQSQSDMEDGERRLHTPDGKGGDSRISESESKLDGLSDGSERRGGRGLHGEPRPELGREQPSGGSGPDTRETPAGSDAAIAASKQRLADLRAKFKKAGHNGELGISLVGMNNEQIGILMDITTEAANLGYQYISKGLRTFNEWRKQMWEDFHDWLHEDMKWSDAEIDEYLNEVWNCEYNIDGVTRKVCEWASFIGQEQLRKVVREDLGVKYERQKAAESIEVKTGDIANIRETLPYLLPEQQDDVLKTETQFFDESHQDREHGFGKGMMFTNGTGTGKTYTGLGIIKRFVKQGKGRVLILTPSQEKVTDWKNDGENLNLAIEDLDTAAKKRGTTATKAKGEGVVITTYANARQNLKLLEDCFDLIVYDESHKITEGKEAEETAMYDFHQMLTNKNVEKSIDRQTYWLPEWIEQRNLFKEREENRKRLDMLDKMGDLTPEQEDQQQRLNARMPEIEKRLEELYPIMQEIRESKREQAETDFKRTKTVFLSATPFNTRENMKYAEGYLFSYPEEDPNTIGGYNHRSPEDAFLEQYFPAGYRWRYGRLESHVENADALSRQEIEFSDYLQNQLGTLSGRMISSEWDYSRDFPVLTLDHAGRFNQAMSQVYRDKRYNAMSEAFRKSFDYNYSTALFEAMKTSLVIERIKEHLNRGQKVVVFHRRRTSGDLEPPFERALTQAQLMADKDAEAGFMDTAQKIRNAIHAFREDFADMLEWEKTLDYTLPRDQIAKVFGEDKVVFFSGAENKHEKHRSVEHFMEDNGGKDIIVVQEASGKEGISLHDTTGKHPRVEINLALPQSPIAFIQIEGRIYRIGQKSNAVFEYPLLGLDLETSLFAQKFNSALGTTENLALGSKARNLRKSIANSILMNSGEVDYDRQGLGGKDMDGQVAGRDKDDFDVAISDYYGNQKLSGKRDQREGFDYFPTPEPVGFKMVEWAQLMEGESALEPSAGQGAIARYVSERNPLTAVEPSADLFSKLQMRAGGPGRRFEDKTFEDYPLANKHDAILMNPPYGTGGKMAMDHVAKAFKHLNEGGRLIAIIPDGPAMEKRLDAWINGRGDTAPNGTAVMTGEVKLPDVAFSRAGTSVRTRIVVIDKVTRPKMREGMPEKVMVDLSGAKTVDELFERLRNVNMPERTIDQAAIARKQALKTKKAFEDNKFVRTFDVDDDRVYVSIRSTDVPDLHINFNKLDNSDYRRSLMAKYKLLTQARDNVETIDYGRWKNKFYGTGKNAVPAVDVIRDYCDTAIKTIANVLKTTPDGLEKEFRAYKAEEERRIDTNEPVNARTATATVPNGTGTVAMKTAYEYKLDKNTKTGDDMHLVVMNERVSDAAYRELQRKAKAMNGYYNRFKKAWHFTTEADARKFAESLNGTTSEEGTTTRFRLREKEAPKKTQKVYKLVRRGSDNKAYPLFIDSASPMELGNWYDADSPNVKDLENLEPGFAYKIDRDGNVVETKPVNRTKTTITGLPNVQKINEATNEESRWITVTTDKKGGKTYHNVGINGSGQPGTFAMRPGWHAGSLPSMRQIGKGKDRNLRDDNFVWVEGEVPADIDYQAEAESNPFKDIPTHIPEDGYYLKATNANKAASQADRIGWYVAGAFKPNRYLSDSEARKIIDDWNAEHPDQKVEYDFERESGRQFNAETMQLEEPIATRFRERKTSLNKEKEGRIIPEDVEKSVSLQIESDFDKAVEAELNGVSPEERKADLEWLDDKMKLYSSVGDEDGTQVDDYGNTTTLQGLSTHRQIQLDRLNGKNSQSDKTGAMVRGLSTDDPNTQRRRGRLAILAIDREREYREARGMEFRAKYFIDDNDPISHKDLKRIFSDFNTNEALQPIFDAAYKAIEKIGSKIRSKELKEAEVFGAANLYDGRIIYDTNKFSRTSTSRQEAAGIMLHEMLHQGANYVMALYNHGGKYRDMLTEGQKAACKEILSLYKIAKNHPKWFEEGKETYGLSVDEYEFMAETSDEGLREGLTHKTYLQRLWDALRSMFGLEKTPSNIERLDKAMLDILRDFDLGDYQTLGKDNLDLKSVSGKNAVVSLSLSMHKEKTPSNTGLNSPESGLGSYSEGVKSGYKVKDLIHNTQEKDKELIGFNSGYTTIFRKSGETGNSVEADFARREKAGRKLANKLHTDFEALTDIGQIKNKEVLKAIRNGEEVPGWVEFDKDGKAKIYMFLPHVRDTYDAQKTIAHEVVGHKGLRDLLGEKAYKTYMRNLLFDLKDPEFSKFWQENLAKNGFDAYRTIDEFLATAAERGYGDLPMWQKVRDAFTNAMRSAGFTMSPSISDVKYMVWLSEHQLKKGEPIGTAERNQLLLRLGRENYEAKVKNGEYTYEGGVADDYKAPYGPWRPTLFRHAPSVKNQKQAYERALSRLGYAWKEAHLDDMQAAVELMRAMSGTKKIEDIPSAENFVLLENQMSSKEEQVAYLFNRDYMEPLDKAVGRILPDMPGRNVDEQLRNLQLYMIKKHGLERNRSLYVRDKIRELRNDDGIDQKAVDQLEEDFNLLLDGLRDDLRQGQIDLREYFEDIDAFIKGNIDPGYDASQHDYSGLSALAPDGTGKGYDGLAILDDVMNTESSLGERRVTDLWEKTKAVSQYGLDVEYEGGLDSKEKHDKVSRMFEWYVPLRGYDETTAEEVYDYLEEGGGDGRKWAGPVLMNANGRESLSNVDVFATLGVMNSSAIHRALRNEMKQAFARFVRKHYGNDADSRLVTELPYLWAEKQYDPQTGQEVWVEKFPDIPENAKADDIAQILDQYEQDMQAAQQRGDAKRVMQHSSIPYRPASREHMSQHIVDVWINGEKHAFVINGNPRAAQAVNGQLKSERNRNWLSRWVRTMAQLNTSYSPDFIVGNTERDAIYAWSSTLIKENPAYLTRWSANYFAHTATREAVGVPGLHTNLFKRYRNGNLDMSNETDRYFKEFMENGGETGWVEQKNIDKWQKEIREGVKQRGKTKQAAKWVLSRIPEAIEAMNERAENMARFTTYMTSRQMGRTITRSVSDAKEVSVNFNRRGAGKKTQDVAKSQGALWRMNAYVAAQTAQKGQDYFMFYNAGVQGLNNASKLFRDHPIKAAATFAAFTMGAIIMSDLNQSLIDNEDEDKRGVKNPYAELPEWIRRNRLCLYVGEGEFVTIDLPIELRAMYGIGDMAAGYITHPELRSEKPMWQDMMTQMTQVLPIDFMGEHPGEPLMNFVPSTAVPLVEAAANMNWYGRRIEKDSYGNDYKPRWTRAYESTNKFYMWLSKMLNAETNQWSEEDIQKMGVPVENAGVADQEIKGSADGWLTDPALMEHIVNGYFGGAGQTLGRFGHIWKISGDATIGEILSSDKMPVVRRLHYSPTDQNRMARTRNRWYHYRDEMKDVNTKMNTLKKYGATNPIMKMDEISLEDSLLARRASVMGDSLKAYNRMKKIADKSTDEEAVANAKMRMDQIMENTVLTLDSIR